MVTVFKLTYLAFLVTMALVVGGATYQTISVTPSWQKDLSLFTNYGHWGIDYFPILSPLMTILWLAVLIMGFRFRFRGKKLLYAGHFFFLAIMIATFAYFAPFLLTYMGKPVAAETEQEVRTMLDTWAKWDKVRQVVGLIPLAIFIYCYRLSGEEVRGRK